MASDRVVEHSGVTRAREVLEASEDRDLVLKHISGAASSTQVDGPCGSSLWKWAKEFELMRSELTLCGWRLSDKDSLALYLS